jgi:hypothetical protein
MRTGRRFFLSVSVSLLFAGMLIYAMEWGPTPYERRSEGDRKPGEWVRSPQLEMAEVTRVHGMARRSGENESGVRLRVGDNLRMGDTVETGSDSTLEVLFGRNGRMRLQPESRVRMVDISEMKKENYLLQRRRIDLEAGSLRVRVRQNTLRPEPVLIIGIGADVTVGRPDMAPDEGGGVDAVVARAGGKDAPEARLTVINGAVYVTRLSSGRRDSQGLAVKKGNALDVPPPKEKFPTVGDLARLSEQDILLIRRRYAFSNEGFARRRPSPVGADAEMDGP